MKTIINIIILAALPVAVYAQEGSVVAKIAEKTKFSGDVQARFESSFTDSINALGEFSADPVTNNFRIRRSRLRADATINKHFSATVRIALQEFAKGNVSGNVLDYAYLNYKYTDAFQVRAGQFKAPLSREELRSSNNLLVIDRGTTNDLFGDNGYLALHQGLMVYGKVKEIKVPFNYYAGVFNGNGRNKKLDENSEKNAAARLEVMPVKWLSLGANGHFAPLSDINPYTFGADFTIKNKMSEKLNLIIEGEYLNGKNTEAYFDDVLANAPFADYTMNGWYATGILEIISSGKLWNKVEMGGKIEQTDYLTEADGMTVTTITPNLGFVFAEDNAARWQFNLINRLYEEEQPGSLRNHLLFVTQFQVRF